MLTVISPAKKLDLRPRDAAATTPEFAADAMALVRAARALSGTELQGLMGLSEGLAQLNRDRFKAFRRNPGPEAVFPAIHCFAGDTYQGLQAGAMGADALAWAERRLRLLSGLYGLLRPMDAIQPYRLEMGSRLATARGADLYAFWGDKIAKALNRAAVAAGTGVLVNCASVEYFAAVPRKALKLQVISPVFLEEKAGEAKLVSFFAKRARGAMARYVCDHHLTDPADLRGFDAGGYGYQAGLSTPDRMVFVRRAEADLAA